jgi:hypothetical protein
MVPRWISGYHRRVAMSTRQDMAKPHAADWYHPGGSGVMVQRICQICGYHEYLDLVSGWVQAPGDDQVNPHP